MATGWTPISQIRQLDLIDFPRSMQRNLPPAYRAWNHPANRGTVINKITQAIMNGRPLTVKEIKYECKYWKIEETGEIAICIAAAQETEAEKVKQTQVQKQVKLTIDNAKKAMINMGMSLMPLMERMQNLRHTTKRFPMNLPTENVPGELSYHIRVMKDRLSDAKAQGKIDKAAEDYLKVMLPRFKKKFGYDHV